MCVVFWSPPVSSFLFLSTSLVLNPYHVVVDTVEKARKIRAVLKWLTVVTSWWRGWRDRGWSFWENFFFFFSFSSVVLFLCWCGSRRGTSRTTSPKPLLVLWENATDHELLSVGGFTEKEGLNENNLNFHHSKDFVFYFSEFGTSRTVKKKKSKQWTRNTELGDQWQTGLVDVKSRHAVFWNVCAAQCVLIGPCGLAQELCCCFVGLGGAEKRLSGVTSCIYLWTELLICLFHYFFFFWSVKTEPNRRTEFWPWGKLGTM